MSIDTRMLEALEKIAYWPKRPDADWVKADAWRAIAIAAIQPCGECHIAPDETCDICGRRGVSFSQAHGKADL